jgi:hypothetical protein
MDGLMFAAIISKSNPTNFLPEEKTTFHIQCFTAHCYNEPGAIWCIIQGSILQKGHVNMLAI